MSKVFVYDGHQLVVEHVRREPGLGVRVLLPEHRGARLAKSPPPPSPQEQALRSSSTALDALLTALRKRHGGGARRAVRHLYRMWLDYPSDALVGAVDQALAFGLIDLHRIESMVCKRVQAAFFQLPAPTSGVADNELDPAHDEQEHDPFFTPG